MAVSLCKKCGAEFAHRVRQVFLWGQGSRSAEDTSVSPHGILATGPPAPPASYLVQEYGSRQRMASNTSGFAPTQL